MKRSLLSLLTLCLTAATMAQSAHWCETDRRIAEEMAKDPAFAQKMRELRADIGQLMASNASGRDRDVTYTIPVVFHVLHLNGMENISNEQVLDAMTVLNRDWAGQNADTTDVHPSFANNIARMDFNFVLATKDPQGHCTNGIVRLQTTETLRGESTSKFRPWPRDKYMNIYVVNTILSGAAGYFTPGGWSVLDGIVIRQDYLGRSGNAAGIPFTGNENVSRALTHEVGHYFDLAHVWGENNGVPGTGVPPGSMQAVCGDDGVEDTPITKGWSVCPTSTNASKPWGDCDKQSFMQYHGRTFPPIPAVPVRYDFDDVSTSSGTTDPSFLPMVADSLDSTFARVPLTPFTAVGVSANSTMDDVFAFSNWGLGANDGETDYNNLTGSAAAGKYYQFTINTPAQQQMYFYGFTFKASRNATGARTFVVKSSADNYNANIAISATSGSGISTQGTNVGFFDTDDVADGILVNVNPSNSGFGFREAPLTLRIYAFNAEDASGSFGVDSLVVRGKSATIENVQNYMEYSYCSIMFTNGQRDRARTAALSPILQRDILWSEQNLINTGVLDGHQLACAPIADFYAQVTFTPSHSQNPSIPFPPTTCKNEEVRFMDNSYRAFPTAWSWTFQDGNPATSTVRNPVVEFTSRGWKTVTLTVSNDLGSDTRTKEGVVYVGDGAEELTAFKEDFEGGEGENLFPLFAANYENNITQWKRFSGGGFSGTHCARLNSGDRDQLEIIRPDNIGDIDDLVSPQINLTNAPISQLSFRYAYRTNTNNVPDIEEVLEVQVSTNCGKTWNPLGASQGTISGLNLVTNGNFDVMPPQPADWRLKTLNLLSSQQGPNTRFRFRYKSSAFSGDLFIDDIQFGSSAVSVQEWLHENFILIFPNPANDQFALQVYGMETEATEVTITDMRGAVVFQNKYQPMGAASIELGGSSIGLSAGLYMVRAQNSHGSSVQKLMMNR